MANEIRTTLTCQHEPYHGRCIHCDVRFVDGRPADRRHVTVTIGRRMSNNRTTKIRIAVLDVEGDSATVTRAAIQALRRVRRTADYHRDDSGNLWKWTRKGWVRLESRK